MSDDGGNGDHNAVYGTKRRAFLQALMSRQTITFEQAKPLIAQIETIATPNRPTANEDVTQEDFDSYIRAANEAISPFDYEIRSSHHQVSREKIYALVNTTSDSLTQLATIHSADEIAFVKRVIDAMFDTYNTQTAEVMAIKGMQALKLAKVPGETQRRESGVQTQGQSQNASLTVSQAEKVLKDMVDGGWFERTRETGFFSLSQRALMELKGFLIELYNDDPDEDTEEEPRVRIKLCRACGEIVTLGQRCPNLPCNTRMHDDCTNRVWRAQRGGEKKCPTCSTAWVDPPPVGEKAAAHMRGGGAGQRHRPSTNGASRGSSGPSRNHVTVESDTESGAELYE